MFKLLIEYERAENELKEFELTSKFMQQNEEKFQLDNMKDLIEEKLMKEVFQLNQNSVFILKNLFTEEPTDREKSKKLQVFFKNIRMLQNEGLGDPKEKKKFFRLDVPFPKTRKFLLQRVIELNTQLKKFE